MSTSYDPGMVGNTVNQNVVNIQQSMNHYVNRINHLEENSNEIYSTSNNNPYEQNNNPINYRYYGPNISGYKELPNIYDGYYQDINQLQLTENTLYISGIIVCTSLIIVGVMLGSSK